MKKKNILILDDDKRIGELLSQYLIAHDFLVSHALNANQARVHLSLMVFDALILDVMLPDASGFDFLKEIRQKDIQTPVIMLTAMGQTEDRIKGLEYGADDYMAKPFEPKELLLRLLAVFKRFSSTSKGSLLTLGYATVDLNRGVIDKRGQRTLLTTVEHKLLKILSQEMGRVFSRDDLLSFFHDDMNERTIDVQIARLRKKIEDDPKKPHYLQTVRNGGYVLRGS